MRRLALLPIVMVLLVHPQWAFGDSKPGAARLVRTAKAARPTQSRPRRVPASARRVMKSPLARRGGATRAPIATIASAKNAKVTRAGMLKFRSKGGVRDVKLVIFDLDGTLVDSRNDIATNFDAGLRAVGVKLSRAKLLRLVDGSPLEKTFRAVLPKGDDNQLKTFIDGFIASQERRGPTMETDPGVRSMLKQLSKQPGIKLAIATARPKSNAEEILKKLNLTQYFHDIAGTDQSNMRHKPAPDVLFHVAKNLNVAPRNAVFVGDTHTDVGAANNAGMGSIAMQYGMGKPAKLRAEKPDYMADDIRKVLPMLGISTPANTNHRTAASAAGVR